MISFDIVVVKTVGLVLCLFLCWGTIQWAYETVSPYPLNLDGLRAVGKVSWTCRVQCHILSIYSSIFWAEVRKQQCQIYLAERSSNKRMSRCRLSIASASYECVVTCSNLQNRNTEKARLNAIHLDFCRHQNQLLHHLTRSNNCIIMRTWLTLLTLIPFLLSLRKL